MAIEDWDDDRAWAVDAKCLGMPPDFFFPVERDPNTGLPIVMPSGADKPDLAGVKEAKRFCHGTPNETDTFQDHNECPVRKQCLNWAIDHDQWEGVYGGEVERDRRREARKRKSTIGFARGLTAPARSGEVGVSPPR